MKYVLALTCVAFLGSTLAAQAYMPPAPPGKVRMCWKNINGVAGPKHRCTHKDSPGTCASGAHPGWCKK
jgi:hypothetical protein